MGPSLIQLAKQSRKRRLLKKSARANLLDKMARSPKILMRKPSIRFSNGMFSSRLPTIIEEDLDDEVILQQRSIIKRHINITDTCQVLPRRHPIVTEHRLSVIDTHQVPKDLKYTVTVIDYVIASIFCILIDISMQCVDLAD